MNEKLLRAKSLAKDEPDEALRICNDVLNEEFDSDAGQMALFMTGFIMMEAERYGLAYQIYQRCLQLKPNMSEIWSNMGMCLEEQDPEKAKKYFSKAVELDPRNHRAIANHALMCLQTGEPQKCIDMCDKALRLKPDLTAAHHNKGLAKLMLRDWSGWKEYHDTLGVKHREARDYGVPEWEGQPGTVLVYGEQGVGDEIMFASLLPKLLKTNKVVFDCDSRLEGLFKRTFPTAKVFGDRFKTESRAADEKFDYQCAIGQLAYHYIKSESDFDSYPFLKADPERLIQWSALLDTFPGKKIGVAWRGGLRNTGEKKRSLEISDLEPLLVSGNTYISLEYKDVPRETLNKYGLKSYPRATDKGGDIDDLAAIIGGLDMVITACTTVVYVAGALGIPCYVLVPSSPGYRYHTRGEFPWFNSVKLIRQQKNESWRSVAKRAKAEIFGETKRHYEDNASGQGARSKPGLLAQEIRKSYPAYSGEGLVGQA